MAERKQYGMKLEVELMSRVDGGLVPGQSRTAFVEGALRAALDGSPGLGVVPVGVVPVRRPKPERLAVARRVKSSAESKAGLMPLDWKARVDGTD